MKHDTSFLAGHTAVAARSLQRPSKRPAGAADGKKVAIANFGPHGSLTQVIEGFKAAMAEKGYVDGKNVSYEYSDCNFDPSLMPQVLAKLEATKPDLLVTVTTPMTQAAVR